MQLVSKQFGRSRHKSESSQIKSDIVNFFLEESLLEDDASAQQSCEYNWHGETSLVAD